MKSSWTNDGTRSVRNLLIWIAVFANLDNG